MSDKEKMVKSFACQCGEVIQPPKVDERMFYGQSKGTFRLTNQQVCPRCQKTHTTVIKGQIENSLIYLEK